VIHQCASLYLSYDFSSTKSGAKENVQASTVSALGTWVSTGRPSATGHKVTPMALSLFPIFQ
jgi:hypothetical protein